MRKDACSREREVLLATRSETVSEEQQAHLDTCPACQESMMVASWMQGAAVASRQTAPLPDAQSIWWRSRVVKQLCDQERKIDRRTRPLMLVQGISTLLVVTTGVGILVTSESLGGLLGSVVEAAVGSGVAGGVPAALVATALVSLGAGAVVAWRMSSELT
jgi:hypothetical protein